MKRKRMWSHRATSPRWLGCYLVILGLLALWADRTEIVLACIGALLTLSDYGKPPVTNSPSEPATP